MTSNREQLAEWFDLELEPQPDPMETGAIEWSIHQQSLSGAEPAFRAVAQAYLTWIVEICTMPGSQIGVTRTLGAAAFDASLGSAPTAREPAAADQERVYAFLMAQWRVDRHPDEAHHRDERAAALATLAGAPDGWRAALRTVVRLHVTLAMTLAGGDRDRARAFLRGSLRLEP
jgi:hypothetical protein